MPASKMVLMGGEKDGWEVEISAADRPDIFFAIPHDSEATVATCKGSARAKLELRTRLAVLAYKFNPETSSPNRFRMDRTPVLDKVRST